MKRKYLPLKNEYSKNRKEGKKVEEITREDVMAHAEDKEYLLKVAGDKETAHFIEFATEALRDVISPFIGIPATKSHFSLTSLLTPSPSLPTTSPTGPVRFRLYIGSPSMSAQTNHIPFCFSSSIVLTRLVTLATGV